MGARVANPQVQPAPRAVQSQSNQRQALIQQAKERSTQLEGQAANEAERRRRIQVSLRRRSQGKS